MKTDLNNDRREEDMMPERQLSEVKNYCSEVSGSHCDNYEDYSLLGCIAV
jgi:hypothetical protein